MSKRIVLIILIAGIVFGFCITESLALTHTVYCVAGGTPAEGVDLEVRIQTGEFPTLSEDWTSVFGETNALGNLL